jgi:hypothetical protein
MDEIADLQTNFNLDLPSPRLRGEHLGEGPLKITKA